MSTATANQPTTPPLDSKTAPTPTSQCLNCGSSLVGHFCSECGQRDVPAHPTIRELFGEAFAEFSGWDGKFAETLRALVLKPAHLTLEFLAGRRARYISPMRLYLTASVVYFLLAEAAPTVKTTFVGQRPPPAGITVQTDNGAKQSAAALTPEDRAELLRQLESSPKWLRPLVQRVAENPKQLQTDVFQAMPKGLFALVPVFAVILAVFYRGRRFADHLYFAIHLHAFVFVALILNELTKFTGLVWLTAVSGIVVLLWLPIYGHLALRRMYGGSQASTLLKELGIGTLYAVASVPMWLALAVWVASRSA